MALVKAHLSTYILLRRSKGGTTFILSYSSLDLIKNKIKLA